jgi:hypothetical protein
MRLASEIERAIKHINASLDVRDKVDDATIITLAQQTITALNTGNYDFSNYDSLFIKKGAKKRHIMRYRPLSTENILCQYIKQILDRRFMVKYPNRNKAIHTLFDFLKAVKQMSEFTIIKFDFKDYFNSVSTSYVFEKYIRKMMTDRSETELIAVFAEQAKYAYAGLNTSNLFAEIIASRFDDLIYQEFLLHGLLFMERYIDDTIIILNQHLEQPDCDKILNNALSTVYHDKTLPSIHPCKTKFNSTKQKIITRRSLDSVSPSSVDFLGYEFTFCKRTSSKTIIQYGITEEKRKKYNCKIDEIIEDYKTNGDMELLRHRIAAFSSRTVYVSKHFNSSIWKTKGFINNYGELRFLIGSNLLHPDTKAFLENMIKDSFSRKAVAFPFFLNGSDNQRGYNLLKNMETNKTLLLVEYIGYDKVGLEKLCQQVGISVNGKGYGNLVREYLIKTKVGY